MTALFYAYMDSPIGRLLMLSDGENLTNLDCELEQTTPNPNWILQEDLPLFEKVRCALTRYFNGEPESFSDIPLLPKGTAFQQAIWNALRQIPYGKTASYGGLAESINNPKAVRAVGGAVGSMWGSDNICIKEKKKFGGKNLAYGLCCAGLGDFVVKFMQKMKMVRKAVKWSKIGFYFA